MDKIVITGIQPYDGEYPFETNYNYGELRTIKRLTDVRAGELMEALEAGDSDIVVAAAMIALQRAGKNPDEKDLWDAEIGAIELVGDKTAPEPDPTSSPAQYEPSGSSGADTTQPSENPASDPSPTGSPLSATGATSDPVTSPA